MTEIPIVDQRSSTKTYSSPKPILDRILVRRIERAATHGFVEQEKYKQQSRRGEVIAVGTCVVLGNEVVTLDDFVAVGDIVVFSEFTAEEYPDWEGVYIVRIQDVRTVERLNG